MKLTKYHLLTIASFGLFIGFWLGFFVFSQIHLKVICRPSGKVLLDTTRDLRKELTMNVNVIGCESIDIVVKKPTLQELIFGEVNKLPTPIKNQTERKSENFESVEIPSPTKKEEGTIPTFFYYTKSEPKNATQTVVIRMFDACTPDLAVSYTHLTLPTTERV